jgi:hypothetical protein
MATARGAFVLSIRAKAARGKTPKQLSDFLSVAYSHAKQVTGETTGHG